MLYRYFVLLILNSLLQISCSTLPDSSFPNRMPSSANGSFESCESTSSEISKDDIKICTTVLNMMQLFSQKQLMMSIEKKYNEALKRHVITLNLKVEKSEVDRVLGRGGLRLRYVRYLANEMSLSEYEKNVPPADDKSTHFEKFTLVEIRPSHKDG